MTFKPIDVSQWNRREHFEHYLSHVPCSYSMTLNLDLTIFLKEIKKRNLKLYPTMIYFLSRLVNEHEEFRTAIDKEGVVGIFDTLYPSYTILQSPSETFTTIWTKYTPLLAEFYKQYESDVREYGSIQGFIGKPNEPPNLFHISSIPWISFTGFNLNLPKTTSYLLPIFTTGKYFHESTKTWLPLAIQVHHAVCDGFHLAKFVHALQETLDNSHEYF